ncbi:MAG: hypothetical protein WB767_01270 [Nocardioides sp.]
MTLLLVAVQFVILFVLGAAALAPLKPELRAKLLPAAPIFGAALLAGVANWTCRWLSIRQSLPIFAAIALGLVFYSVRKRRRPFTMTRGVWGSVALVVAASLGGLALAGAPSTQVASAGDSGAVAPAYIIDGFYFGGVSTYLVDDPLLPGPTTTGSWVGNDPPATAPARDTVQNRLRFGQSAVAATLSVMVFQPPYETLGSISLLWLLLLGAATFVSGTLLGLRRPAACVASLLVTSSAHVVSQPLQGQNDGLLGASLFLLALALSSRLIKDPRHTWPLVLVGAGLAATYSEYFVLLVPAIVGLALVGPRAALLHRLNLLGGRWAASVVLVPWAWVWLAQSFKVTSRTTNGPSPFAGRSGWELFRAYLGTASPASSSSYALILNLVGLMVLLALCVGWVAALVQHRARGALAAMLLVVGGFELYAVSNQVGNLQYRVVQLGLPVLLLFAVVGWSNLLRRGEEGVEKPDARQRVAPTPRGALPKAAVALAAVASMGFVASNLVTIGITTSHERAANQHVPDTFVAAVRELVEKVGDDNVTVVTPNLTDLAALSMSLVEFPGVDYPAVVSANVYVGFVPHWDREVDPYYVVGPGASVVGDATYVLRDGRYSIVQLDDSGVIVAPFRGPWLRTTFMRGSPCAREGVSFVVIRGENSSRTFRVATAARVPDMNNGLVLYTENGASVRAVGRPDRSGQWTTQTFRAPKKLNSIVTVTYRADLRAQGMAGVPMRFGQGGSSPMTLDDVDPDLIETCMTDNDSGLDGYDRELTLMRARP